jgi:hypothetical protein
MPVLKVGYNKSFGIRAKFLSSLTIGLFLNKQLKLFVLYNRFLISLTHLMSLFPTWLGFYTNVL